MENEKEIKDKLRALNSLLNVLIENKARVCLINDVIFRIEHLKSKLNRLKGK